MTITNHVAIQSSKLLLHQNKMYTCETHDRKTTSSDHNYAHTESNTLCACRDGQCKWPAIVWRGSFDVLLRQSLPSSTGVVLRARLADAGADPSGARSELTVLWQLDVRHQISAMLWRCCEETVYHNGHGKSTSVHCRWQVGIVILHIQCCNTAYHR